MHEAVHIFQRWCDDRGEHTPSHEFQAYSIQWISQELMEEFVRQTGGRSEQGWTEKAAYKCACASSTATP